tara:strand:+ start:2841 stop:4826 length:1986 start_codon:yes stop_codon:yes gene_type:complete
MDKGITNESLSELINRELNAADSWSNGDLADQQAKALDYYYGQPFGDEEEGFSSVVTRDTLKTVEGIMPSLMKVFASGDTFVEFEPVGAEDVAEAQQATDYLNYVFDKRCDGFSVLYTWFKDALLMKNGLVEVSWTQDEICDIQNFTAIEQIELDALESEEEVEIVHKEINEEDSNLYDITIRRTNNRGRPVVDCVPSSEFRIKARSKSIKDSDFIARVQDVSIGSLIDYGFERDDISEGHGSSLIKNQVEDARFGDVEEPNDFSNDTVVEYVKAWVRTFDEEDEKMKLFEVHMVGNTVLEKTEVGEIPIINLSPIMMPHKFTGVSIADLVQDIQEIRSKMWRHTLDNLALSNAGRYAAVENQVNLQDLIDNRIGGIVREKVQGAVRQLPVPQLGNATFPFLNELEKEREDRAGVSRMTQGLDAAALTSNTAATAVNQVMTAAQEKIQLIARIFAETGVKELFLQLYRLSRTNNSEVDIVKLRGRFVPVSPFDWKDRFDMTVTVGLGNQNKDQQLMHLNNISTMLQGIGSTRFGYLINAEHVHTLATEFIQNAGYKNSAKFIGDPREIQPPEAQPSADMVAAQGEAQKDMADAELKKVQAQAQQAESQMKQAEFQLKLESLKFEREKFEWMKKKEAAELGLEAQQKRPVGIGDSKLRMSEV